MPGSIVGVGASRSSSASEPARGAMSGPFDAPRGRSYAASPSRNPRRAPPEIALADATPTRAGWAFRPVPPTPRSVAELIRSGTLDAELAATLWVLLEGRVPVIVAGQERGSRQVDRARRVARLPARRCADRGAGRIDRDVRLAPPGHGTGLDPRPRVAQRPAARSAGPPGRARSCSSPSCPTTCRRTRGARRRASRSGPPRSGMAWRPRSTATRSRRSSSSSAVRRSGPMRTSCRGSGSS